VPPKAEEEKEKADADTDCVEKQKKSPQNTTEAGVETTATASLP
jgi:hypothetical protein